MALRCWSYSCMWGCYQYGYASEQEAESAAESHECLGMKA